MTRRGEALLWVAQRASAAALALCVLVHLATMIYAVKGGLSAAEILGRTRGNAAWAAFYGIFAAMAAVHGSIGLRSVLAETLGWRSNSLNAFTLICAAALALWGWRAVYAVIGA